VEPEFYGRLDVQDADNADTVALMLQTGYLAVRMRQVSDESPKLYLTVPNKEVGNAIARDYIDKRVIPSISPDDENSTPELCKEFCSALSQLKFSRV
jgi:hypothetical protein